jgi:hypothetical protein
MSLPFSPNFEFIQELPPTLLGPDPPISQPITPWVALLRICPGLTPCQKFFDELIMKVYSITLISPVNNKLQKPHESMNLLHHYYA